MHAKSSSCWNNWCRPAFTLIEVVASLMLLGTLLVAILVAHRRHAQQIRGAEARLAAVEAADELLAKWTADGSWGATTNSGQFENRSGLSWRWTVVPAPELRCLGAAIGRLEVIGKDGSALERIEILTMDTLPN